MRMVMGISWPAWQIEDQNHDHCRHDANGPAWQSEWWGAVGHISKRKGLTTPTPTCASPTPTPTPSSTPTTTCAPPTSPTRAYFFAVTIIIMRP